METCLNCPGKFHNPETNTCKDPQVFVNKNNIRDIVCRYNENAVLFNSVEEYKIDDTETQSQIS